MLSLLRPLPRLPTRSLLRHSSSSSSSSIPSSVPSRVYPGLYYHPTPSSSPSWSLSYLPTPPPSLAFSPTTLGTVSPLPSSSSSSSARSSFDDKDLPERTTEHDRVPEITPRNFQDNKQWLKLVHEVLEGAVESDPWVQTQAKAAEGTDTYIHIADLRSPADANRQPNPQDILASVLVQSGKVVPSSYEPNAHYRPCSMDGIMRLPEGLMGRVVEACRRVREVEVQVAAEQGAQ